MNVPEYLVDIAFDGTGALSALRGLSVEAESEQQARLLAASIVEELTTLNAERE